METVVLAVPFSFLYAAACGAVLFTMQKRQSENRPERQIQP
jgi:hypothetical protein